MSTNTSLFDKSNKSSAIMPYIKGATVALIVSLVGILIFAFVLKFIEISEGMINPINQVIKAISILIGVKIALKHTNKLGWLKGALLGIVYTLLAYLIFSFLSSSIMFDQTTLIDMVFGGIMGAICGIIMVNAKKNN